MMRSLLWIGAAFAALVLGRRGRRSANAPPGRARLPAFLSAVASGLAEAWRVAGREYRLHAGPRERQVVSGWRGGEARALPAEAPLLLRGRESPGADRAPAPAAPRAPGKSESVTTAQQAADEPSALVRWRRYLQNLFQRYVQDQCPVFAAALSFFALLSTVPVLLVAIAALGYLLQDPAQARDQILGFVQQLIPGQAARQAAVQLLEQIEFENRVRELMERRGLAGVIGVLTLIWAAMQIFVSAVPAMNVAWDVTENRGWLKLRLVALGLLFGAGALFLLSLVPSSGPELVRRLHVPWLGLPEHVPWPVDLFFTLLAVAINAAMFALIYRFLPAAEVTWKQAAVGGATMGVLWELAKRGFAYYLATFGGRNPMYGALGGAVILVTWIYYTSMLLLLGAEVAKLYKDVQERKRQRAAGAAAGR